MKSLKQQSEELSGINYYDPRYTLFIQNEIKLFNKVSKYLTKEIQKQGGLVESSFIHSIYRKIWNGEMTFNQLKKMFKSCPDN